MKTAATRKSAQDTEAKRSSQPSSERLVREIIRGMYEARYVPGQRLVEQDLAEEYAVSRSTVREALKLMSADGIVTISPYKGAQIRKIGRDEAIDLLRVVEMAIGLTARLAAEKIGEPGASDLLNKAVENLTSDPRGDSAFDFAQRRNRFYATLSEIGGNRELARIMLRLQVHLIRNRLVVPPEVRVAGYRTIAEKIAAGDPEGAEEVARAYARNTLDRMMENF